MDATGSPFVKIHSHREEIGELVAKLGYLPGFREGLSSQLVKVYADASIDVIDLDFKRLA